MADSTTNSDANPYQAPQATSESKLSFDTQFLVSETCVACEENLQLPPVCIVSGATSDVIQLSKRLAYYPGWLKILYIILIFCIPVAIGAFDAAPQGMSEATITLSVIGLMLFLALFGTFCFRRTIDASWYVHKSQFKKLAKRRTFLGVLLAGSVAFGAIMAGLNNFEVVFLPIFAFCMTGAALFKTAPPRPIFRGHHEGLNVVMGLSPEFLAQVKLIIDQHSAKPHE